MASYSRRLNRLCPVRAGPPPLGAGIPSKTDVVTRMMTSRRFDATQRRSRRPWLAARYTITIHAGISAIRGRLPLRRRPWRSALRRRMCRTKSLRPASAGQTTTSAIRDVQSAKGCRSRPTGKTQIERKQADVGVAARGRGRRQGRPDCDEVGDVV